LLIGRNQKLPNHLAVSVVICAYTEDRWSLVQKAVASVEAQTAQPVEIILCIDHNDKLLQMCKDLFLKDRPVDAIPFTVVPNKYDGHLGSARNTAVELASGEIVAFLDDDAAASSDWLERLISSYDDQGRVGAVGGAPLPVFERGVPRWFPREFYWVFGCAYRGMPEVRGPLAHLIGANMSARRSVLIEIGGFHSDNHDDMDMCHRTASAQYQVIYEPLATVQHAVPASRTTWRYFWRRCYFVNKGKAEAFSNMESAASLGAELGFVTRIVPRGILVEVGRVVRGDGYGLVRIGAMIAGVGLAGFGHVSGKLSLARAR
jgi:cellulose synthase/poly-beta-1,6-N-acetylglucosamine synthase-like glycosyltransferase